MAYCKSELAFSISFCFYKMSQDRIQIGFSIKRSQLETRTTDTQWRHKSKKSENLGRCGRQNMLRPYLKIWEREWIFGSAVKAISSLGVRSPWVSTKNNNKQLTCTCLLLSRWVMLFPALTGVGLMALEFCTVKFVSTIILGEDGPLLGITDTTSVGSILEAQKS